MTISIFNVIVQILNSNTSSYNHILFLSFWPRNGQIDSSYIQNLHLPMPRPSRPQQFSVVIAVDEERRNTKVLVTCALSDQKESIQEREVNPRNGVTAVQSQLCDVEIAGLMCESVQARGSELTIAITMAERGKRPTCRGCSRGSPRALETSVRCQGSVPSLPLSGDTLIKRRRLTPRRGACGQSWSLRSPAGECRNSTDDPRPGVKRGMTFSPCDAYCTICWLLLPLV